MQLVSTESPGNTNRGVTPWILVADDDVSVRSDCQATLRTPAAGFRLSPCEARLASLPHKSPRDPPSGSGIANLVNNHGAVMRNHTHVISNNEAVIRDNESNNVSVT